MTAIYDHAKLATAELRRDGSVSKHELATCRPHEAQLARFLGQMRAYRRLSASLLNRIVKDEGWQTERREYVRCYLVYRRAYWSLRLHNELIDLQKRAA